MTEKLPKIAWLSPLPPQRSGIANYSYWLTKALRPYLDIDLYYEREPPVAELKDEFAVYPLSELAARYRDYDEVVYHVGNHSDFHKEIYTAAWHLPSTLVLHDYNIGGFMYHAFYRQQETQLYEQALIEGYGERGRQELQALARTGRVPDPTAFPMSHAIVSRSKKVIVHHRWVKQQFIENRHIEVIPHFAKLNYRPAPTEIESFRRKFLIKDNHFILSCLGFINSNKLPGLQIEVVKRLLDDGYPVQMIFGGEPAPEIKDLETEVRSGQYAENIIFTGYQNESDYFSTIFASDVVINLRNPSMGEASGTLMHALAAARPTIISDINQYREFPDKVCWKLSHDEHQAEVLCAYLSTLLGDPELRTEISDNARRFVSEVLALEKVVERWLKVILS